MKHARFELARGANLLPLLDGTIAALGQINPERLRGLNGIDVCCECNSFTASTALRSAGFNVCELGDETFDHAAVFLPRSKTEALHLIARAVALVPDGWVFVDGQKTDGIDSIAKQIAREVGQIQSYSKGHGKLIWFEAKQAQSLEKWLAASSEVDGTFSTAPGVFSADGVDPASAMLLAHLPDDLSGATADLGAGWGFLSAGLLARAPAITTLQLIEDNSVALDCAKTNVLDKRARFYWADALNWTPPEPIETVIMNPPFHTTRTAEPQIGLEFIRAASCVLKPGGRLFMVANAHLPYEQALEQHFARYEVIVRTGKFKVFCAERSRAKVR